MADIVLATLNARYQHAAFGLRYLLANLGTLRERAVLREFTINQPPLEVLDAILEPQPRIVAIGVYIWNVEQTTRLVADLKRVRPDVTVILGGPEVSYETDQQEIMRLADYVITGEADLTFPRICEQILTGDPPSAKIIPAALPSLDAVRLPYELYTDEDIAHRVIYVEASRGCPFECEFCLSALDIPVRQFPLERFLAAMQSLLDRGARQFKFVDRTFNLNLHVGRSILQFFLDRSQPGMFLHFEMIPDRLPERLRELIVRFPPGALQFEVGIQTFNEEVAARISRRQDNAKVEENLGWLRDETGVHVHADLIVGLPGETVESFAAGFDRLARLGPREIQVGMLKRLRGTPIIRHDAEFQMVYSPHAPYEILRSRDIDFAAMQRLRRFAKCWDLIGNSGNFVETRPLLWQEDSPFRAVLGFSEWLFAQEGRTHSIALTRLTELLFCYLTTQLNRPGDLVGPVLWRDYQRGGRSDRPRFLRPWINDAAISTCELHIPRRQARHVARVEGQFLPQRRGGAEKEMEG